MTNILEVLKASTDKLLSEKSTVSVVESCTGGLLGHHLTYLPGSSSYFQGGMITYSNEAKINILGVNEKILRKFGAVSKEVAEEMAFQIRDIFASDYGISITGIAGPEGGTAQKPVGTVWIGIAKKSGVIAHHFVFTGDREENRKLSSLNAIKLLLDA